MDEGLGEATEGAQLPGRGFKKKMCGNGLGYLLGLARLTLMLRPPMSAPLREEIAFSAEA